MNFVTRLDSALKLIVLGLNRILNHAEKRRILAAPNSTEKGPPDVWLEYPTAKSGVPVVVMKDVKVVGPPT